jgi:hypothetical protein
MAVISNKPIYPKLVYHAGWKAIRFSELRQETYEQLLDDIFSSAYLGFIEDSQSYAAASNAAGLFIHNQVKKQGMTGGHAGTENIISLQGYLPIRSSEDIFDNPPSFPVLALARLLKRLLRKKGKRGRHSASIKSCVIVSRMYGDTFQSLAWRYNESIDNVKRHYRMGWSLLIGFFMKNINMLSAEQVQLLSAVSRKQARNFDSAGKLYEYNR